jgi:hypothetical protein
MKEAQCLRDNIETLLCDTMKFILTIDAEADNQWVHGTKISTDNLRFLPRIHKLCLQYTIYPTYLVTSEVCTDEYAKELLRGYREASQAEIGAHLHIWTTPPFEDKAGLRFNDHYHGFATELPEPLLRRKIEHLTQQIENAFGKRPTSFRSGRYGFNETCANMLLDNGYLVDSSVTPYIDWSFEQGVPGETGGPDFSRRGAEHYRVAVGNKSLLEIPVTILPTRFPFTVSDSLTGLYSSWGKNVVSRGIKRLSFGTQPVWLRPFPASSLESFRRIIEVAARRDLTFITMMLHSSELMPGCSPYRKDQRSVEALYTLLEEFFALLHNYAIPSVTLSAAASSVGDGV